MSTPGGRRIRDLLVSVAGALLAQNMLKTAGLLDLVPLPNWEWRSYQTITYVLAAGIAAVACLWSAKRNGTKLLLAALGLAFLVSSYCAYAWVTTHPPTTDTYWYYTPLGQVSFFSTYAAFGFVIGRLVSFLPWKSTAKSRMLSVPSTTILFAGVNPPDTIRIRCDEEQKIIRLAVERTQGRFHLVPLTAVVIDELRESLITRKPRVVHFCGHGTPDGDLKFEDNKGKSQSISREALATLFHLSKESVKCVLLNACYSEPLGKAIRQEIDYVIGMKEEIGDDAALAFCRGFYAALVGGQGFDVAFQYGINSIELMNIPESLTPVLLERPKSGAQ